jgi:hypothetical protein
MHKLVLSQEVNACWVDWKPNDSCFSRTNQNSLTEHSRTVNFYAYGPALG